LSNSGRCMFEVTLDLLPDIALQLPAGSLYYEGPVSRRAGTGSDWHPRPVVSSVAEEDVDEALLEDTVSSDEIEEDEEEEEINLDWTDGEVVVDPRLSRPDEAFHGRAILHLPGKELASPATY